MQSTTIRAPEQIKGKNFYQCIKINNLKIYAPGRPIYWPSDPNKTPDILDIAVANTAQKLEHQN